MSLENVVFLHPVESVSLDAGVFQALVHNVEATCAMSQADDLFEEFIVCLSAIETAWAAGEFGRLSSQAEVLGLLSENLGLGQCSVVAAQVTALVDAADDVALAAVVARLVRLGEASLASALEYAYQRI